jgi:pyruvate dehydrogenase E2 component (dihydrolipoamide acetyltransferase)
MDLKLPHLGEGADSGTVVNLFVKEGDKLAKDQPVLELENEKAVATIPSTAAGTVTKVFVKSGDKLAVGQRILSLDEGGGGASLAGEKPGAKAQPVAAPGRKTGEPQPEPEASEKELFESAGAGDEPVSDVEPAAAPSIRKMASDLGIDLRRIKGSERGGRIILEDVRSYIQRLQQRATQPKRTGTDAQARKPVAEQIDFARYGQIAKRPMSPLRQVIARRMSENWLAVPRVTQFDEADITTLIEVRKKHAPSFEKKGVKLTLTSFVIKILAETLKKHPIMNSSIDEVAQEIIVKEYYHIGIAVDTEAGLIVPVIRDADKKNLEQISRELDDLAKKARDRKVSGEDLKGGTFTISNQGGIGGGHFTPIVNKPEVAILGLGRGVMKAVVRDGKIEPRMMLPIAVSYDHRAIDGAVAARFTVDLVERLQMLSEKTME